MMLLQGLRTCHANRRSKEIANQKIFIEFLLKIR